jgi:hypothetical protein
MADADQIAAALLYQQELEAATRPQTMNPNIAAQGNEIRFQREIAATPWYTEFTKQYGESPDLSKNANYDYRKAWNAGVRPERDPYDSNRYHWPSSTPTGEMLKSATHPTAWKEHYMQAKGVNPDAVGATEADWLKIKAGQQ